MFHCLKKIDQDHRRNVYPNHDYTADRLCCGGGITCLRFSYWWVYIGNLFFGFHELILMAGFSGTKGWAVLAVLFVNCLLVAHQCFYRRYNGSGGAAIHVGGAQ